MQCVICEAAMELVDKLIENNATDEKINATLYRLCSGLPDGALKDIVSTVELVSKCHMSNGIELDVINNEHLLTG